MTPRGSFARAARSLSVSRSSASSQPMSRQPGSTPMPLTGLVRTLGDCTLWGEYRVIMAAWPLAQVDP